MLDDVYCGVGRLSSDELRRLQAAAIRIEYPLTSLAVSEWKFWHGVEVLRREDWAVVRLLGSEP